MSEKYYFKNWKLNILPSKRENIKRVNIINNIKLYVREKVSISGILISLCTMINLEKVCWKLTRRHTLYCGDVCTRIEILFKWKANISQCHKSRVLLPRRAYNAHIPLSFIIFHVGNMNTLRRTWWRVIPCVHFVVLFIFVSVAGYEAAQLALKLLSSVVPDKIHSTFVRDIFSRPRDITANIIELSVSE